jgi:hypothetical protein
MDKRYIKQNIRVLENNNKYRVGDVIKGFNKLGPLLIGIEKDVTQHGEDTYKHSILYEFFVEVLKKCSAHRPVSDIYDRTKKKWSAEVVDFWKDIGQDKLMEIFMNIVMKEKIKLRDDTIYLNIRSGDIISPGGIPCAPTHNPSILTNISRGHKPWILAKRFRKQIEETNIKNIEIVTAFHYPKLFFRQFIDVTGKKSREWNKEYIDQSRSHNIKYLHTLINDKTLGIPSIDPELNVTLHQKNKKMTDIQDIDHDLRLLLQAKHICLDCGGWSRIIKKVRTSPLGVDAKDG